MAKEILTREECNTYNGNTAFSSPNNELPTKSELIASHHFRINDGSGNNNKNKAYASNQLVCKEDLTNLYVLKMADESGLTPGSTEKFEITYQGTTGDDHRYVVGKGINFSATELSNLKAKLIGIDADPYNESIGATIYYGTKSIYTNLTQLRSLFDSHKDVLYFTPNRPIIKSTLTIDWSQLPYRFNGELNFYFVKADTTVIWHPFYRDSDTSMTTVGYEYTTQYWRDRYEDDFHGVVGGLGNGFISNFYVRIEADSLGSQDKILGPFLTNTIYIPLIEGKDTTLYLKDNTAYKINVVNDPTCANIRIDLDNQQGKSVTIYNGISYTSEQWSRIIPFNEGIAFKIIYYINGIESTKYEKLIHPSIMEDLYHGKDITIDAGYDDPDVPCGVTFSGTGQFSFKLSKLEVYYNGELFVQNSSIISSGSDVRLTRNGSFNVKNFYEGNIKLAFMFSEWADDLNQDYFSTYGSLYDLDGESPYMIGQNGNEAYINQFAYLEYNVTRPLNMGIEMGYA